MKNSLNNIIIKKEKKLNELKKAISIESLREKINENKNFINFKEKIESRRKRRPKEQTTRMKRLWIC